MANRPVLVTANTNISFKTAITTTAGRPKNATQETYWYVHSSNPPPPPFIKGGIDFLKFGNKSGDEIFFLEKEGLD